jgi:hypothetical protein
MNLNSHFETDRFVDSSVSVEDSKEVQKRKRELVFRRMRSKVWRVVFDDDDQEMPISLRRFCVPVSAPELSWNR